MNKKFETYFKNSSLGKLYQLILNNRAQQQRHNRKAKKQGRKKYKDDPFFDKYEDPDFCKIIEIPPYVFKRAEELGMVKDKDGYYSKYHGEEVTKKINKLTAYYKAEQAKAENEKKKAGNGAEGKTDEITAAGEGNNVRRMSVSRPHKLSNPSITSTKPLGADDSKSIPLRLKKLELEKKKIEAMQKNLLRVHVMKKKAAATASAASSTSEAPKSVRTPPPQLGGSALKKLKASINTALKTKCPCCKQVVLKSKIDTSVLKDEVAEKIKKPGVGGLKKPTSLKAIASISGSPESQEISGNKSEASEKVDGDKKNEKKGKNLETAKQLLAKNSSKAKDKKKKKKKKRKKKKRDSNSKKKKGRDDSSDSNKSTTESENEGVCSEERRQKRQKEKEKVTQDESMDSSASSNTSSKSGSSSGSSTSSSSSDSNSGSSTVNSSSSDNDTSSDDDVDGDGIKRKNKGAISTHENEENEGVVRNLSKGMSVINKLDDDDKDDKNLDWRTKLYYEK